MNLTQRYSLICFVFACVAAAASESLCDVRAFGAKGDKAANDTAAIQRAIDACANGGGTVFFQIGRAHV